MEVMEEHTGIGVVVGFVGKVLRSSYRVEVVVSQLQVPKDNYYRHCL